MWTSPYSSSAKQQRKMSKFYVFWNIQEGQVLILTASVRWIVEFPGKRTIQPKISEWNGNWKCLEIWVFLSRELSLRKFRKMLFHSRKFSGNSNQNFSSNGKRHQCPYTMPPTRQLTGVFLCRRFMALVLWTLCSWPIRCWTLSALLFPP